VGSCSAARRGRRSDPNLKLRLTRARWGWGAGQELTLAWLHKFYPTLRNRDLMERMRNMPKNYFYSMALGRDLRGYSIGPHTDTADKWVTTLYYLPRYDLTPHPNSPTTCLTQDIAAPHPRLKQDWSFECRRGGEPHVLAACGGWQRCAALHALTLADGSVGEGYRQQQQAPKPRHGGGTITNQPAGTRQLPGQTRREEFRGGQKVAVRSQRRPCLRRVYLVSASRLPCSLLASLSLLSPPTRWVWTRSCVGNAPPHQVTWGFSPHATDGCGLPVAPSLSLHVGPVAPLALRAHEGSPRWTACRLTMGGGCGHPDLGMPYNTYPGCSSVTPSRALSVGRTLLARGRAGSPATRWNPTGAGEANALSPHPLTLKGECRAHGTTHITIALAVCRIACSLHRRHIRVHNSAHCTVRRHTQSTRQWAMCTTCCPACELTTVNHHLPTTHSLSNV
jgi:hypothetical protein